MGTYRTLIYFLIPPHVSDVQSSQQLLRWRLRYRVSRGRLRDISGDTLARRQGTINGATASAFDGVDYHRLLQQF
jgi:hypothetical protein